MKEGYDIGDVIKLKEGLSITVSKENKGFFNVFYPAYGFYEILKALFSFRNTDKPADDDYIRWNELYFDIISKKGEKEVYKQLLRIGNDRICLDTGGLGFVADWNGEVTHFVI